MSAAPLVANLKTKVSALSTSIGTVSGSNFIRDTPDHAWRPLVPPGHSSYTWGLTRDSATYCTKAASTVTPVATVKVAAPVTAAVATPVAAAAVAPATEKAAKGPKPAKAAAVPEVTGPDAEFYKLDIRVGQVTNVRDHPGAESLYLFDALVGGPEPVQVVTNLKKSMTKEELEGIYLVFICNLKPAAMRGEKSFAMIMGATNAAGEHGLLFPAANAVAGDRLTVAGSEYPAEFPGRASDKVIAAGFEKLTTNASFQLTFDGKVVSVSNGPIVMPNVANAIFAAGK